MIHDKIDRKERDEHGEWPGCLCFSKREHQLYSNYVEECNWGQTWTVEYQERCDKFWYKWMVQRQRDDRKNDVIGDYTVHEEYVESKSAKLTHEAKKILERTLPETPDVRGFFKGMFGGKK